MKYLYLSGTATIIALCSFATNFAMQQQTAPVTQAEIATLTRLVRTQIEQLNKDLGDLEEHVKQRLEQQQKQITLLAQAIQQFHHRMTQQDDNYRELSLCVARITAELAIKHHAVTEEHQSSPTK